VQITTNQIYSNYQAIITFKDHKFQDMYQYLKDGQLTGDNERNRLVLLLLDQYFIENNALDRRTIRNNIRETQLHDYTEKLCILLTHRRRILKSIDTD